MANKPTGSKQGGTGSGQMIPGHPGVTKDSSLGGRRVTSGLAGGWGFVSFPTFLSLSSCIICSENDITGVTGAHFVTLIRVD